MCETKERVQKRHKGYKVKSDSKQKTIETRDIQCEIVENKISDFKTWLSRFHGVATKYLQSYLMWFVIMNKYLKELIDSDIGRLLNLSSHDRWAWDKYREIVSQRYY